MNTEFPHPTTGPISAFCRCGCGEPVASYRSIYRPGHDSKHISNLLVGMLSALEDLDSHKTTRKQYQSLVDEAFMALSSSSLQDRLYNAVVNYGRGRLVERLIALRIQPFEAASRKRAAAPNPADSPSA